MAIYHLSVKPVSRAAGRSATGAAAYRSAGIVHDETTGQTFDYTRKQGVEHAEIVLPTRCARQDINWARDRQQLWNAAEQAENRSNSRVAREYEVALPHELDHRQRVELVRAFSRSVADRYGCAVDFAIHAPHREGDQRNHHAHLLSTTRTIEATGLGEKTAIEWSDGNRRKAGLGQSKEEIVAIRAEWAAFTNERLQALALEARIDHRTLEAQGIDRQPTVHLGPAVSGMQRRGMRTEVGYRLQAEATARLERAAALEREAREVGRSIVALDADVAAALRAREALQQVTRDPRTPEERRHDAVQNWLRYREQQAAREKSRGEEHALEEEREVAREQAPDKARDHTPDDDFSL